MRPPLVRRSSGVPAAGGYKAVREFLRADFSWACAYCSMTEREAQGFSMEIDHYRPQNDGGTDAYENLYYSCRPCNRRKGAWVPSPVRANLIQIDKVHPDDHLELAPGGESLSALSDSGTASIEIVDLNRYSLRQLRLLRAKHEQSRRVITHGLRTL